MRAAQRDADHNLQRQLSERPYTRMTARPLKWPQRERHIMQDIPVRRFMSTTLVTVRPEDTFDSAARLMEIRRVHHALVIDGAALVGILSSADLLKVALLRRSGPTIRLPARMKRSICACATSCRAVSSPSPRIAACAKWRWRCHWAAITPCRWSRSTARPWASSLERPGHDAARARRRARRSFRDRADEDVAVHTRISSKC